MEQDLQLASGRLRVRIAGRADAPPVFLIHGLSANLCAFEALVPRLASKLRCVIVDLRGRGRSDVTAVHTYGLAAHARDVLEIADRLGFHRFSLVGWSMGAGVGLVLAENAPQRLDRLVLIDLAGPMDPQAIDRARLGLARLDAVVQRPSDYLELVRRAFAVTPWSSLWDRYFTYELAPGADGLRPSTSRAACLEDLADLQAMDWARLWRAATAPTLLIRCRVPMGGGYFVPEAVRDAMAQALTGVEISEVQADHYSVLEHEESAIAIRRFLERRLPEAY